MTASIDKTYCHVQGLSRGLSILKALNESESRVASPRELSEKTRLHRTTVKRILETLVDEGYIRPCNCDGGYGLTAKVLSLSCGLTDDAPVLHHAAAVLKELCHETGWSLRISTRRDDCMEIRDNTHAMSHLSFEAWGGLGRRLPMLLTAAGRACFASCSDEDRSRIVETIRGRRDEQWAIASDGKLVEQLTRRVLDDGFAVNDGDWGERRLGAVGVPIRQRNGRSLATLSMLYTRRAVTKQVIENEFVPVLRRSAASIEAHLQAPAGDGARCPG